MVFSVSAAERWSLMEQTQFGEKRAAAIRGSRANGAFHRTITGLLINLVIAGMKSAEFRAGDAKITELWVKLGELPRTNGYSWMS